MTGFERFVKNVFQKFGILIRKYNAATSEDLRRTKLFQYYNVDLVFDIGANTGQYATGVIDAGYNGKLVSFEPLSSVYDVIKNKSNKYSNWTVPERCAIGGKREEIEINISANSVSSTLLNMKQAHYDGDPESKIVGKEKVQVIPLDEIGEEFCSNAKNIFLKIDVQGFEQEVLAGAANILEKAKGVEMEISLVPLYDDNDWLLPQVLEFMSKRGFELKSLAPAFTNNETGVILQCNGIFFREN